MKKKGLKVMIAGARLRDRKVILGAFSLALILSIVFIFGDFLCGNKFFMFNDVGSDTLNQYYPFYISLISRIKDGTFGVWNSQHALGTSMINNVSQTLDPFGLIVIIPGLIAGIETVKYMLVIMQIAKILASAYLCRIYLKLFNISEVAACLSAYLYAFNGYLMLWGQHYIMGTGSVYLVLILFFLESSIRKRQHKWKAFLSVSVMFSMIYSYYMTYMILMFCGMYFIVRIFYPGDVMTWLGRIKMSVSILIAVLSGIMLSGVILLPSAAYLFNSSSRLNSGSSLVSRFFGYFFSISPLNHIGQTVSRLISNNLLYIDGNALPGWGNYYEMPTVFYTIFIFMIFTQFIAWIIRNISKEYNKAVYYIFCVCACIFFMFNRGISMAFNGFAYPQGRYMFVIIPMFALMTGIVWSECIEKARISICGVICGISVSIFILMYSFFKASVEVKNYSIVYGILVLTFAGTLIYIVRNKIHRELAFLVLLGLFLTTTIMDNYITNNQRNCVTKEDFLQENGYDMKVNSTLTALDYLKQNDKSVYRVEKNYIDFTKYGDPVLEGYGSITDYNSTVNRNVADFYNHLYSSANYLAAFRAFSYKNKTDVIPLQMLNVKYYLSRSPRNYDEFEYVDTVDGIYIYKSKYAESIARWYEQTISKDECEEMLEEDRKTFVLDMAIVEGESEVLGSGEDRKAEIGTFTETASGHIEGNIKVSQSGLLMLAIPDQQGWTVYANGNQQDIINTNYGFIGVKLNPGDYKIEAVYVIPYLKEGMIVSLFGGILFVLQLAFSAFIARTNEQEVMLGQSKQLNSVETASEGSNRSKVTVSFVLVIMICLIGGVMFYKVKKSSEMNSRVDIEVDGDTVVYEGIDYSPVYNFEYYIRHYKDIEEAYSDDEEAAFRHFVEYGMSEGRQANENFDVVSYIYQYQDLRRVFGNDLKLYYKHYAEHGYIEGRIATGCSEMQDYLTELDGVDYSDVYDYNYYVKRYEDVRDAYGYDDLAVLTQFVKYGMKMGRKGCQ